MGSVAMVQISAVSENVSPATVRSSSLIPLLSSLGWTGIRATVLVVAPTSMYAIQYLATAVEVGVSVEWTRSSVAQDGKSFYAYVNSAQICDS